MRRRGSRGGLPPTGPAPPRAARGAPGRVLAALLLVLPGLVLPALGPPAAAQVASRTGFGSVVQAGEFDAVPGPLAPVQAAWCSADLDRDGARDPGEPIVLRPGPCAGEGALPRGLGPRDLVLSGPGAGRPVPEGAPEAGAPALPLPAPALRFSDRNRDGQWSRGDGLYLLDAPAASVAPGHLRLALAGNRSAGSLVVPGDPDVGEVLTDRVSVGAFRALPPEALRLWDTDLDGAWDPGEPLYLDLDGSGDATVMDVRLGPAGEVAFGSALAPGDRDAAPRLQAFGPAAALCFVDTRPNGAYDPGEPVYFRFAGCPPAGPEGPARVTPWDVRLSGAAAGTKVAPGDSDVGAPAWLAARDPDLRFADLDRDGRWSAGDAAYVHLSGSLATVAVGDLRLSVHGSLAAGTFVAPGDSDLRFLTLEGGPGTSFDPAPGRTWRYWDADGDLRFEAADVLYADLGGDGALGSLDLRLSPLGGVGFGRPLRAGDADAPPRLAPGHPAAALCFRDADGDGAPEPGEGLWYQRAGCGPLAPGDVPLDGERAGVPLGPRDEGLGAPTLGLPGFHNLRYYDADDSASWSAGDTLYLHLGLGASRVAAGDLRVTPYGVLPAATFVARGEEDLDLGTLALTAAATVPRSWRFWDLGGREALYLDLDGSGSVTALDVRLSDVRAAMPPERLTVAQVSELQRAVEALEELLAAEASRRAEAERGLAGANATLAGLRAERDRLLGEKAALERDLAEARAAPPPRQAPDAAPALGVLALALAAARLARRGPVPPRRPNP